MDAAGAATTIHPMPSTPDLAPRRVHLLQTGAFRLDGGGMFGLVPKTMW